MNYAVYPKRNGLLDNLIGSSVCLVVAAIIYAQPALHAACQATRVGSQVYLMTCGWPAFTFAALLLASVLLPILGLISARFVDKPAIGVLPISFGLGLLFSFLSMAIAGEFAPFGLAAGVKSGLVFTLARDHTAAIFQRTATGKAEGKS
ncbi:MAG: hypothetical protein AAFR39_08890 [Pseudomonadota bacterium]